MKGCHLPLIARFKLIDRSRARYHFLFITLPLSFSLSFYFPLLLPPSPSASTSLSFYLYVPLLLLFTSLYSLTCVMKLSTLLVVSCTVPSDGSLRPESDATSRTKSSRIRLANSMKLERGWREGRERVKGEEGGGKESGRRVTYKVENKSTKQGKSMFLSLTPSISTFPILLPIPFRSPPYLLLFFLSSPPFPSLSLSLSLSLFTHARTCAAGQRSDLQSRCGPDIS